MNTWCWSAKSSISHAFIRLTAPSALSSELWSHACHLQTLHSLHCHQSDSYRALLQIFIVICIFSYAIFCCCFSARHVRTKHVRTYKRLNVCVVVVSPMDTRKVLWLRILRQCSLLSLLFVNAKSSPFLVCLTPLLHLSSNRARQRHESIATGVFTLTANVCMTPDLTYDTP